MSFFYLTRRNLHARVLTLASFAFFGYNLFQEPDNSFCKPLLCPRLLHTMVRTWNETGQFTGDARPTSGHPLTREPGYVYMAWDVLVLP